jgi:hypothetical protein
MIGLVTSPNWAKEIYLVQSDHFGSWIMPVFKGLRVSFSAGKSGWEIKLTVDLHLVALQRMRGGIPLHHGN